MSRKMCGGPRLPVRDHRERGIGDQDRHEHDHNNGDGHIDDDGDGHDHNTRPLDGSVQSGLRSNDRGSVGAGGVLVGLL